MHRPFRFEPPPSTSALLRPRLLDVLARRFDLRLVTLEAAAGLGKTTLLAHAVTAPHAGGNLDCWLTCEPADASASTLLAALLHALDVADVGEAPQTEHVCDAIWSRTPAQVCLVLDDVHAIAAGSPGSRVVQQLLDELPENGHLVVAGRWLPDLARTRLRVQGRAVDVTEEQLRLDDAETAAFASSRGVHVDVVRGAAGWPALAELHAATGRLDAERFVWEEVLAHLPERDRDAFVLIAAIGGAEADTAEAVAGGPFDRALLRSLPLVASDELGAIKPHALWVDLLRARIDPLQVTEARHRLADALTAQGQHGQAFELLAAAADWDAAPAALFDACNDQVAPPWPDQLERWRGLLPTALAATPESIYLDAMIARARDPWCDEARDRFAASVAAFNARGDVVRELTAGIRSSFAAWLRGDTEMLDLFRERIVEIDAAGIPLASVIEANHGVVADIEGDSAALRAHADAISDIEPRLRHFKGLFRTFADLADGCVDDATLAAARDAAVAAVPVTPAAGTGWAASAPGIVRWVGGDLQGALEEPPTDPGPRLSAAERIPALAVAAVAAAHVGEIERASMLLRTIDDVAAECGDRDLLAAFRAITAATIAVADNREHEAAAILDKSLGGRPLTPMGAGRAVRWLPTLPYLLHAPTRAALAEMVSGPSRANALKACRALLDVRAGRAADVDCLFESPATLLTALPATLAVELLVRVASRRPSAMHVGVTSALVDLAPRAVREALRQLAESDADDVASTARALLARVPIPPPHHVRIEVLGPTRLLHDGDPVVGSDWRRARVRQLVCALVSLREVRRARLGTMLWPEFDEKSVSSNLRMTLSYVQNLLEPQRGRGDAPWFLQQDGGVLRLRDVDHLTVDAWELDAALDAADDAASSGATTTELAHLQNAIALWRGDVLEDVAGEEWAEPLREHVRHRFVRAAVRCGELLVANGQPADAIAAADKALSADPWCEPAIRLAISAHLAAGDRSAARTAYDSGRKALADLGISPEPATEELGRRLHATR